MGYRTVKKNYDNNVKPFSSNTGSPERVTDGQANRQTDGRTDKIPKSIWRVSMLTRDKNDLDACCHQHTSIIAMVAVCLQHYSTREDSLMRCGSASPSAAINGVRCVINSTVEVC